MISGWDIYWVMQLDSIRQALAVVSISALILSAISPFIAMLCNFEVEDFTKFVRAHFGKAIVLIAIPFFIGAILPSSRTAAAILIIPALANNEAIQKEAGDLYQLAKDGLRQLVEPEEKPEK